VVCRWYRAKFNVVTGDVEDMDPTLPMNLLPVYPCRIDANKIYTGIEEK